MKCSNCEQEKSTEDFQTYTVGGKEYIRKQCRACKNSKQTARRKNVRDLIADYRVEKGCKHCGFNHPAALQFHHTSDDKEINVADATKRGWSLERIMDEIDKCIVLCANCHLILHYQGRRRVEAA